MSAYCLCGCGKQVSWLGIGRKRYFFDASCRKRFNRGVNVTGRLSLQGQYWVSVLDGDTQALDLFKRHYSFEYGRKNRKSNRFVGVGSPLVLVLDDYKAGFVWLNQSSRDDNQNGLYCAKFRNESPILSSELILDAEFLALQYWPETKRFFTFVNPLSIKSPNPGYCFKCAGWNSMRFVTGRRRLVILEKILS